MTSKKKTATIKLPVNNDFGIATFGDFIEELNRMYCVEVNTKNNLFQFIHSNGLQGELQNFYEKIYEGNQCDETEHLKFLLNTEDSLKTK